MKQIKKTEKKAKGEKQRPCKRGGIWIDPMSFPNLDGL
jgi:hypothetical protein